MEKIKIKQKLIAQGAEAKIFLSKNKKFIIKDRVKKLYRINEIDEKIRKQRTKAETKLLEKASNITNSPKPIKIEELYQIKMPFIKGKKLSEKLDDFTLKKQKEICFQIGQQIARLHEQGIIHGDLTTSNMIFLERENKIYFIDFGLGFISDKKEDKAVDLHLLKQSLNTKHFKNAEILFHEVLDGYRLYKDYSKVLERLQKVENRGRYKH
jgi:TP53 regulating kinase-like protein